MREKEHNHINFILTIIALIIIGIVLFSISLSGKDLAENLCKERFGNNYDLVTWTSKEVKCEKKEIIVEPKKDIELITLN